MRRRTTTSVEPDIETLRKHYKILVIDDHALPAQRLFERDGYHLERWPEIKNLSQLTDGHYEIILLDLHGVGLNESPDKQGLGILRHIKQSNPAQIVIAYSAQAQKLSARAFIELADSVLDKEASYVDYKEIVDNLLRRRASPGYFLAVINRELGDNVILVPDVVPKAINAFKKGQTGPFEHYLRDHLPDAQQVDRILTIISIGITAVSMVATFV
jgi:CheY-like chemotaxis protein